MNDGKFSTFENAGQRASAAGDTDKPHWFDAARMLEAAARRIRLAAAADDDLRGRRLFEAGVNIEAAIVRLKDAAPLAQEAHAADDPHCSCTDCLAAQDGSGAEEPAPLAEDYPGQRIAAPEPKGDDDASR